MTTDRIATADPAAAADQGSMIMTQNVFQRLLTSAPGRSEVAPGIWAYKPDLARECFFTSASVFACTLNTNLTFSNGHPITSADAKFSIERAIRLDVPGSSASTLSSVRRIETPDPLTVRFVLNRYDRQFGWALASPAASIVDSTEYSPDDVQANDEPVVGSGPFTVTSFDERRLDLARFGGYVGRTPATLPAVRVVSAPDSPAVEQAVNTGQVDVVWRGLSSAALARLGAQVDTSPTATSRSAFSRMSIAGARVLQLRWNSSSPYRRRKDLRAAVAAALQEDRTLDSVVPPGIPGHQASFPLGGRSKIRVGWASRIRITLGYDPAIPDGADVASQVRSRLEAAGGISVRLRPSRTDVDLLLEDRKAWTATAFAWLQPVLVDPLESSRHAVAAAEDVARESDAPEPMASALADLQVIAARDLTVLPLTQRDEQLFLRAGVQMARDSFGPGWQLGLWGISTD